MISARGNIHRHSSPTFLYNHSFGLMFLMISFLQVQQVTLSTRHVGGAWPGVAGTVYINHPRAERGVVLEELIQKKGDIFTS